MDPFLKIPPESKESLPKLGLNVLDEPKCEQSHPTVLEIQMKMFYKSSDVKNVPTQVRNIENANKNILK